MKLKEKLADPALRLSMEFNTIPSPVVTQAIAAAGADIVVIDQEHGAVGREALHAMIAATKGTDCAPLVRVVECDTAHVKPALDMGAEGIVFPLIRSAEDARACVAMTRYPPEGVRGWGAFLAHSRWDVPLMDYAATFGDRIVTILLIETAEAVEQIEDIAAVEGVDALVVAQYDLSTALGCFGDFAAPRFTAALARIEAAVAAHGVALGGGPVADAAAAKALFARGYRILGGFDVLRLKAAVAGARDLTR
ncbi:HpcH/HpaI aldolase family protein [Oceanibium sediminis]|uniref:HpcH/HpaI aldolase family protein n=1 Tax=Oceanibium sediminis TaxID=2026339 RepID=UPI000DD36085|nr:aldolase/citrate lyase family protein [Oceanibium sediminis]